MRELRCTWIAIRLGLVKPGVSVESIEPTVETAEARLS